MFWQDENDLAERYQTLFDEHGARFRSSPFTVLQREFGFPLILSGEVYAADTHASYSSGIVIENLPSDLTGRTVLDLGCGSGVIAIAAAYRGADVIACDYDENALDLAHHNIYRMNAEIGDRVRLYKSDLFSAFQNSTSPPKFDLIAANIWFPVQGSHVHQDCLEFYDRFFAQYPDHLKEGGCALLTSAKFADTKSIRTLMHQHHITPFFQKARRAHFDGQVEMDWYLYSFDRKGHSASCRTLML